jgi:purine-nucleoside phosphorylase
VLIIPELIWGGPVTAILIEELFALGVRRIVGFGAAGSINPEVRPGDIFIAQQALCLDGTSKEYTDEAYIIPDLSPFKYNRDHRNTLEASFLTGLTTDSLYRETPRKVKRWRELGADFINLEVSPFYVVSMVLGIPAIYMGLITDFVGEPWESTYWNIDNEVDVQIIESIKELCLTS